MLSWLITYENEGKKGNDFSTVPPFEWLLKYREKLPNIVLVNWQQEDVRQGTQQLFNQLINIENDFPEVFKEPVVSGEVPENTEEVVSELPEENVPRETDTHVEIGEEIVEWPENEADVFEEPVDPKEELKKKRAENLKKAREAKKAKAK
jgi:hypothetical protein